MRRKLKTMAELEKAAGIERTVSAAFTRKDIMNLTRKRLGRRWGRKR